MTEGVEGVSATTPSARENAEAAPRFGNHQYISISATHPNVGGGRDHPVTPCPCGHEHDTPHLVTQANRHARQHPPETP